MECKSQRLDLVETLGLLFFREIYNLFYEKRGEVVAWKARWAGRLNTSEANVKSIGGVKR